MQEVATTITLMGKSFVQCTNIEDRLLVGVNLSRSRREEQQGSKQAKSSFQNSNGVEGGEQGEDGIRLVLLHLYHVLMHRSSTVGV